MWEKFWGLGLRWTGLILGIIAAGLFFVGSGGMVPHSAKILLMVMAIVWGIKVAKYHFGYKVMYAVIALAITAYIGVVYFFYL